MSDRSEKLEWRVGAACCVLGGLCLLLPASIQTGLRAAAADCLRPGQTIAAPLCQSRGEAAIQSTASQGPSAEQAAKIAALELRLRQEQLVQADLRRQLASAGRIGTLPYVAQTSEPLIRYSLVSARVLGREKDLAGIPALLVDLGQSGGAQSQAFVVHGTDPVLDVGAQFGVDSGQPVYAGRTVVGRIERTGRWTSAVQLVTDPDYTGRAQLLRESSEGPQFGAEGLITGQGDGTCRLSGIPYTEPVSAGDGVYTGGRTAQFPVPMFYGTVIEATLESGQRWNIVVRPHINADHIREVAVLRQSLGSTRILGQ